MSTITAILDPDADGTVHLPLPEALRRGKIRITATIEAADEAPVSVEQRFAALEKAFETLRRSGTFREIDDAVAWQRKTRKDRQLPGRD